MGEVSGVGTAPFASLRWQLGLSLIWQVSGVETADGCMRACVGAPGCAGWTLSKRQVRSNHPPSHPPGPPYSPPKQPTRTWPQRLPSASGAQGTCWLKGEGKYTRTPVNRTRALLSGLVRSSARSSSSHPIGLRARNATAGGAAHDHEDELPELLPVSA